MLLLLTSFIMRKLRIREVRKLALDHTDVHGGAMIQTLPV